MEHLEQFIREWGYWAVFLGACVEGESVILLACYAAYKGHLTWEGIISVAFFATLCADQGLFLLGRSQGAKTLKRWPLLQEKSQKVFQMLHRYDIWFVLSFRFIYGIRVASPLILGASRYPPIRFMWLNVLAALLWTAISFSLGYAIAHSFEGIASGSEAFKTYALKGLGCLVGGWVCFRLWRFYRARFQGKS